MLWLIIAGLAAVALLAALLTWRYWLLTRPGLDLEAEDESADDTDAHSAADPDAELTARMGPGGSPNSIFVPPPEASYPPPAASGPDWGREMPQGPPRNQPRAPRPGAPPRRGAPEQRGFQASHLAQEPGSAPAGYDAGSDGWGFAPPRRPPQRPPEVRPTETPSPPGRRASATGSAAAAVPPRRRDGAARRGPRRAPNGPANRDGSRRQGAGSGDGRGGRGSGRASGDRSRGDPFWDWRGETDGSGIPRGRNDSTSRRALNREDVWPAEPNDPDTPRRRRRPRR